MLRLNMEKVGNYFRISFKTNCLKYALSEISPRSPRFFLIFLTSEGSTYIVICVRLALVILRNAMLYLKNLTLYNTPLDRLQMEQSLESLFEKVDSISKGMSILQANVEEMKDKDPMKGMTEEEKKEAKQAMEEDEKKEVAKKAKRASKLAAIRKAMEEDDDEKKEAAIKKAMDDYDDEKNGMTEHPKDEKKDPAKQDHIASIIEDKRREIVNKILIANKILNPTNITLVEKRLYKANLTEVDQEWKTIEPFVGSVTVTPPVQEKVVPFFANYTPSNIDDNQLNANSPDSEFSKISTKDLLSEMYP